MTLTKALFVKVRPFKNGKPFLWVQNACSNFLKGHEGDEERLMRRITIVARRNNLRASQQRLTENQREGIRRQDAAQHRAHRQQLVEHQREGIQRQDTVQHRENRHQLAEHQREGIRRQNAAQHRAQHWSRRQAIVSNRPAVDNTNAILSGEQDVMPCSIGVRSPCAYCNALLWIHEKRRTSICCRKGKIEIERWIEPDRESENEAQAVRRQNP